MISILDDCRTQTAVLFTSGVRDKFGDFSFTTSEIMVRWVDKAEQFTNGLGEQDVSMSIVRVSEDLAINTGNYLYLGTLASLSGNTNPKTVNGAFEVKKLVEYRHFQVIKQALKLRYNGLSKDTFTRIKHCC